MSHYYLFSSPLAHHYVLHSILLTLYPNHTPLTHLFYMYFHTCRVLRMMFSLRGLPHALVLYHDVVMNANWFCFTAIHALPSPKSLKHTKKNKDVNKKEIIFNEYEEGNPGVKKKLLSE